MAIYKASNINTIALDPSQQQAQQQEQEQLQQTQQQSQQAIEQQQQFGQQAAGLGGYQNLTDVYSQQAALADQLRQMASGQGPNPAVAQLQQATQQNIQNQKALMASQRGAGANVGAMQRRIGQQAAGAQQQGTAQEATLRAQQQVAAMNALQQQQAAMAGMATGQAGMQQQALANLLGGTQGLQGLSQQQLQAIMGYGLGQQGLDISQTLGQAGLGLQQQIGNQQFISNLVNGLASAGASTAGAFGKGYTPAADHGTFNPADYTQAASGDRWVNAQGNVVVANAHGGEIEEYAEGGPVYADSSNQAASLKENYEEDEHMHHYADGGSVEIAGKEYSTSLPNVVDPQGHQAALLQAMQAAQGSQAAIGGQQDIVNKAAAMGGMRNMADVYGRQQALAGQLGQLARGEGPNPALEQYRQAMGQNVEAQAAMMAGQRGAGPNAALAASQAGRMGTQAGQQLAGTSAGQAAEQQMQGVSALQRQQGEMGRLAGAEAGLEAGAAETLMKGTQGLQGLSQQQLAQTYQNELTQRAQQQKYTQTLNELKFKQDQANRDFWGNIAKGVLKGVATVGAIVAAPVTSGASLLAAGAIANMAQGGEVKKYAQGGNVQGADQAQALKQHYADDGEEMSEIARMFKHGSISPKMAYGGVSHDMRAGGHVPGQAPVGGAVDSYKNDIVDAKLSPGEIVLPRSVTQSANPVEAAAKFVAAIKAKKGK